jgi:hypothetical protein
MRTYATGPLGGGTLTRSSLAIFARHAMAVSEQFPQHSFDDSLTETAANDSERRLASKDFRVRFPSGCASQGLRIEPGLERMSTMSGGVSRLARTTGQKPDISDSATTCACG